MSSYYFMWNGKSFKINSAKAVLNKPYISEALRLKKSCSWKLINNERHRWHFVRKKTSISARTKNQGRINHMAEVAFAFCHGPRAFTAPR